MKTKILSVLCGATLIVGCCTPKPVVVLPSSNTVEPDVSPASKKPLEQAKKKVELPADLLQECPPLPDFLDFNPSANAVLKQKALDAEIQAVCRKRYSILLKIVKEAFNIP